MLYIGFSLFILISIAIAGFISGAETALTGASKAYIYHLAKKGNVRAKYIIDLQKNMATTIGTILVVNQMIIYFIPIISTVFAFKYLTTTETAVMQTITGLLLLIYAEIFPKMLAIQFTSRYALFVAPIVKCIVFILHPVISVLEYFSRLTLKLFGASPGMKKDDHSNEELRGAIEMHSPGGDEDEVQKKAMLKNVLDLADISVSHTMVHRKSMFTIDISLPIEKIAESLMNCQFSRVPLWKDNPENIVGILKTKTFFRAAQMSNGSLENLVINNLITIPWYIPETTHLLDQLQNFRKKKEHFALVVDEYGDLMGCITLEDVLEEIVGDIGDEYDVEETGMRQQVDGCVIVDGSIPVRDINRQFDWNLPEEEAATIAGYVMHELRKIPDAGQIYTLSNYKIEILRRQRNQIGLLKVTKINPTEE